MRLWCPRVINHRTVTNALQIKWKRKKDSMWEKVLILSRWLGQSSRLKTISFRKGTLPPKDKSRLNWISFSLLSLWERPISFLTAIYVNELSSVQWGQDWSRQVTYANAIRQDYQTQLFMSFELLRVKTECTSNCFLWAGVIWLKVLTPITPSDNLALLQLYCLPMKNRT